MPEENLSLQPIDTLSQPSDSKKNPNRFILFTESWLNLQNYITTCLDLPITQNDFGARYGDFSDVHQIQQVVAAMKKVQNLTGDFGSPKTIKDKGDTGYLLKPEPPNEIYAHMIWLAIQLQGAASTFTHTLGSVKDLLNPSMGTKEERAGYLKEVLVGNGGLVSVAEDMVKKTNVLREKVRKFGGKIEDGNEELARYTSQQSTVVKAANEAIEEIKRTLERLDLESKAAMKAWRGFTIAAAVASVGLAILSCLCLVLAPFTFGTTVAVAGGLGVAAVAAATALGIAATAQLKEYNRLCGEIKKEDVKKQQKVLLVSDLNSLNEKITVVGGGMGDFLTNLNTIEGIWLDIAGKLTYICSNYTFEKLSDYVWIQQAMKITDATQKWHEIGQITTEFTQNSLVNYKSGTFGTPVEEKSAAA
jgi:hypothetical protein